MVRIASVSDLHTDYADNREAVVALATEVHRRGADLVIIAGDISHKDDRIRRVLAAFREVATEVAYVPGNHDVWFEVGDAPARPDLDTWTRYREDLRRLAESEGVSYLPAGPWIRGGVAVAGSCGWYDYSFLLPEIRQAIGEERLAKKELDGFMWADARMTAFRDPHGAIMPDAEIARVMERDLELQLAELARSPSVRDVVAVTHHLAFESTVRRSHRLPWEFFNGFMGSRRMGNIIRAAPKVRAAIYGHTHVGGDVEIDGLRVYGTPLGYPRERIGVGQDELVRTRIGWIEL